MRTLCFTVAGQTLTKAPECNFSGLVAGTRGYLRARFRFSADWTGCKKIAIFTGCGKPIPVPLAGDACTIPDEALTGNAVEVYVVGQRDKYRITTSACEFKQAMSR